jgi:mediator of RNA polymerase II transcription subunit 21
MSRSIAYLTSRANFTQVSAEIPVTKQRNPDKVDPPDVFEGKFKKNSFNSFFSRHFSHTHPHTNAANKKELVNDLMAKAKQIEYLIQNLPTPELEEVQVRARAQPCHRDPVPPTLA